jgi:nuclear pore complex protein Nup205
MCTALVAKSGTSAKRFRILFEPTLYDGLPRDPAALQDLVSSMCNTSNATAPPHLGIVLYVLNTSSQLFTVTMDTFKQQHRKFSNLSDLSADEIKQLYSGTVGADVSGGEAMSAHRRCQIVSARLVQSLYHRSHQLRQLAYIIENSMFLLWRHLEFYLMHCCPIDTQATLFQLNVRKQQQLRSLTGMSSSPADVRQIDRDVDAAASQSAGVTREQLDQLRRDVVSSLSDALFTRLDSMEECYTQVRTRYGFVSALVRRLKRLVRLHAASKA